MKKIIKCSGLVSIVILSLSLFSFSKPKGGDMFEIYLNNELILQRHVYNNAEPAVVSLKKAGLKDILGIRFLHCAQPGTNRSLQLKDASDHLLKEWKFSNTNAAGEKMNCPVQDLLNFKKTSPAGLHLYYASDQLKAGKLVATIQ